MRRSVRRAALLSETDGLEAFERAADAQAAGAEEAASPAAPKAVQRISGALKEVVRAALDAHAAQRVGGAWTDAVLAAVGEAVHAAVPAYKAPHVTLLRAWAANNWRASQRLALHSRPSPALLA